MEDGWMGIIDIGRKRYRMPGWELSWPESQALWIPSHQIWALTLSLIWEPELRICSARTPEGSSSQSNSQEMVVHIRLKCAYSIDRWKGHGCSSGWYLTSKLFCRNRITESFIGVQKLWEWKDRLSSDGPRDEPAALFSMPLAGVCKSGTHAHKTNGG